MTQARSDERRQQMNAFYTRLRNGAAGAFRHDGLIHLGCPKAVVIAYVAARFDGLDPAQSIARAYFGENGLSIMGAYPDGLLARAARGWAFRLAQLEAEAGLRVAA